MPMDMEATTAERASTAMVATEPRCNQRPHGSPVNGIRARSDTASSSNERDGIAGGG